LPPSELSQRETPPGVMSQILAILVTPPKATIMLYAGSQRPLMFAMIANLLNFRDFFVKNLGYGDDVG
jgi:hypothetical protein